jgi:hypothetical protein
MTFVCQIQQSSIRSNLAEAARRQRRPRQTYRKAGDAELLAALHRLVNQRPTYGYRRLARIIHEQESSSGLACEAAYEPNLYS